MDARKTVTRAGNVETAKRIAAAAHRRNRLFAIVLILFAAAALIWLLYAKVFIVRHVEIRGRNDIVYTEEQALAAAKELGILPGDHLFAIRRGQLEKNARYRLSEFDKVEVRYRLPDTLLLRVTESVPMFYMIFDGETYILSESLRVTKRITNAAEAERMALKHITFSNVVKCVAGDFLEVGDGADETLLTLCEVLGDEGMLSEVDSFDLSNRFDIRFTYRKRFIAKIGDAAKREYLVMKVRYLAAIADDMSPTDNGYIDVSDEKMIEGKVKSYS